MGEVVQKVDTEVDIHRAVPSSAALRTVIHNYTQNLEPKLKALNHYVSFPRTLRSKPPSSCWIQIHANPELAYKEYKAHDAICSLLEELGYQVKRHAYGLETAFEVVSGNGGRTVNFNAEFDALPGIGHACGHNLIATAAVTGFLGLAYVLKHFEISGRVQLLGTPAEEDGGGKIDLLKAGAYENVDVSLMV